ncbi:MAG TPA: hypothetical protein VMH61_08045 [Candidatus Acidoferrales bacterium]|nr:hypothetical protein [Candidatus Acidoferrales bacterium]
MKIALGCAGLLLTLATSASATQLNIAWDNCVGDGGTVDKAFACNTNSGRSTLVLSLVTPTGGISRMTGAEALVYVATSNGAVDLPMWWSTFNAGTCREPGLSANTIISDNAVHCLDGWSGQASAQALAAYWIDWDGPGTARIDMGAGLPEGTSLTLDDTDEYFLFNCRIAYSGTVGGACPGCSSPACLLFHGLDIAQSSGDVNQFVATGPRTMVSWQGGGASIPYFPYCPASQATPAARRTWGEIKSLYR